VSAAGIKLEKLKTYIFFRTLMYVCTVMCMYCTGWPKK